MQSAHTHTQPSEAVLAALPHSLPPCRTYVLAAATVPSLSPGAATMPTNRRHTARLASIGRSMGTVQPAATRYLHTMIRVVELEKTLAMFKILGLGVQSESPSESGRFTNIFLSTGHDTDATIELTHNWDGVATNHLDSRRSTESHIG